jgi:hypothetical protein
LHEICEIGAFRWFECFPLLLCPSVVIVHPFEMIAFYLVSI